jgi:N-formylglutamate deformylase
MDSAVVFASPHSGRDYSNTFKGQSILDPVTLRSSEDAYVDQLIDYVPEFGAPLLLAHAPRAFVDLNRSADELDPAIVNGAQTRGQNPRISSGLGVIPRVVANGRPIYRGKIPMQEAKDRLRTYWHPYHDALLRLLKAAKLRHGYSVLIDVHSMPHDAVSSPSKLVTPPEIVIGDRHGSSASRALVEEVEACFANAGLKTARNTPFAGAFITQHYGHPSANQHAIQIEIDRGIYLNEAQVAPSDRFTETREKLLQAVEGIARLGAPELPLAAE